MSCILQQRTGAGLNTSTTCYWDTANDGITTVQWPKPNAKTVTNPVADNCKLTKEANVCNCNITNGAAVMNYLHQLKNIITFLNKELQLEMESVSLRDSYEPDRISPNTSKEIHPDFAIKIKF